jgi:uncharacterized membrane protein
MKRFSTGSAFTLRGRRFNGLSGFEGKPFHPPLTDLPVGAYVIAPILDVVSFIGRDRSWGRDAYTAAGYTLLVGAIASALAALTGLADWLKMRAGSEVRRIANTHALTMIVVSLLVIADLAIRFTDDADVTSGGVLVLSLAIGLLVFLGAAIGGSLVFDKGYKVRKRPAGVGDNADEQSPSAD